MVTGATYRQSSARTKRAGRLTRRTCSSGRCADDDSRAKPSAMPCSQSVAGWMSRWPVRAFIRLFRPKRRRPRAGRRTPILTLPIGRSVYIYVKRNLRYPLFHIFDVPDSNETCARRHVSTNAPQALALLNSQMVRDLARSLAQRIARDRREVDPAIDLAVKLTLGRTPGADEKRTLSEFLTQTARGTDQQTALEDVCHVLLNLNEFLYLD